MSHSSRRSAKFADHTDKCCDILPESGFQSRREAIAIDDAFAQLHRGDLLRLGSGGDLCNRLSQISAFPVSHDGEIYLITDRSPRHVDDTHESRLESVSATVRT